MKQVKHNTGVTSLIGTWSVLVVFSPNKALAAWCFLSAQYKTFESDFDTPNLQRAAHLSIPSDWKSTLACNDRSGGLQEKPPSKTGVETVLILQQGVRNWSCCKSAMRNLENENSIRFGRQPLQIACAQWTIQCACCMGPCDRYSRHANGEEPAREVLIISFPKLQGNNFAVR